MGPQSCKSPNFGNWDSHLGVLGKNDIWVLVPWARHRVYYKGEGGGFPQVRIMVSLMSTWLLVVHMCTKVLQLRINQLFIWFMQVSINELLINLPSPILELQHTPLPPKCCKLGNAPQLLLPLSSHLDSKLNPLRSLGVC